MTHTGLAKKPYRGLPPYERSDAEWFFGRDADIETIAANLIASPLTVLFGASGVGKSSILNAGVAPRLTRAPRLSPRLRRRLPRKVVVIFKNWTADPVADLQSAIRDEVASSMLADADDGPGGNREVIAGRYGWPTLPGVDLLVILDQFEEYFVYHRTDAGHDSFGSALADAVVNRDISANFLIAIREDELAKLDTFSHLIPGLLHNRVRLDHLDANAARLAIRQPINRFNALNPPEDAMSIDDDLVEAVIEDVSAARFLPGYAGRGEVAMPRSPLAEHIRVKAPYLQLVMSALWDFEQAQGSRRLRRQSLDDLHGVEQIVQSHLNDTMVELKDQQDVAADMFLYLVTPSGSKIALTADDLCFYAKRPSSEIQPVLDALSRGDRRILFEVPPPPGYRETRYEIFHDALAPAILDWRVNHLLNQEREKERMEVSSAYAEVYAEREREIVKTLDTQRPESTTPRPVVLGDLATRLAISASFLLPAAALVMIAVYVASGSSVLALAALAAVGFAGAPPLDLIVRRAASASAAQPNVYADLVARLTALQIQHDLFYPEAHIAGSQPVYRPGRMLAYRQAASRLEEAKRVLGAAHPSEVPARSGLGLIEWISGVGYADASASLDKVETALLDLAPQWWVAVQGIECQVVLQTNPTTDADSPVLQEAIKALDSAAAVYAEAPLTSEVAPVVRSVLGPEATDFESRAMVRSTRQALANQRDAALLEASWIRAGEVQRALFLTMVLYVVLAFFILLGYSPQQMIVAFSCAVAGAIAGLTVWLFRGNEWMIDASPTLTGALVVANSALSGTFGWLVSLAVGLTFSLTHVNLQPPAGISLIFGAGLGAVAAVLQTASLRATRRAHVYARA